MKHKNTCYGLEWSGIDFDLVPAVETGKERDGEPVWKVWNRKMGGWQITSPLWHKAQTSKIDEMYKGKLRQLVRVTKAWNSRHNLMEGDKLLRSFHIELLARKFIQGTSSDYGAPELKYLLHGFFKDLRRTFNRPFLDPISGIDVRKVLDKNQEYQVLQNLLQWLKRCAPTCSGRRSFKNKHNCGCQ